MTQPQTRYDAIIQQLTEKYGDQYQELTPTDNYWITCTLSYAITDMMDGQPPDEAWERALTQEAGEQVPEDFRFEELAGKALKQMIYVQFDALTNQQKASR